MVVLKKRNIVIVSVLLITAITFAVCFGAISSLKIGETTSLGLKVVLDAGHGGIDPGVVGRTTGVKESEINLKIVKKTEELLVSAGVSVVLTRSSDAGLYGLATKNLKRKDMEKRKKIIESANPDLVVSVHLNSYSSSSRRGAQVFYKDKCESSLKLASCMQNSFNSMESAVRECAYLKGDYYILSCSSFPSVICECGFLSNPDDENLLITEEYQTEMAYAIFKGIINYFADQTQEF